ncbi:STAS domain-containing protein [Streptomyces sp. NPDC059788]|uniref:STAS domain-containing protein n=1 Tax=Streptomyces sp. NPDC059788 TaxID=3346948 RepID=UPI00365C9E53
MSRELFSRRAEPPDSRLLVEPLPDPAGPTVLHLTGELDVRTVNLLCDTTVALLEAGDRRMRLDLSRISWCDNASLYTILGLQHAVLTAGGHLGLTSVSWPVAQAIARNSLWQFLRR